jgi:hypothetical protein
MFYFENILSKNLRKRNCPKNVFGRIWDSRNPFLIQLWIVHQR